jgi:hypothetical protein
MVVLTGAEDAGIGRNLQVNAAVLQARRLGFSSGARTARKQGGGAGWWRRRG